MAIPFVRDIDFEYGRTEQVSPRLRRVIANNPGPFTYVGTGVYIVGQGEVAVIDPGPHDAAHFAALKAALAGETVRFVLVTHGHCDHSSLAHPLAQWAGCKVHARDCSQLAAGEIPGPEDDTGFMPDEPVSEGDIFSGPGWTLEAVTTPGHTRSHVCFALEEENACLSGDHVMGWSTTIVAPPDGNMADYLKSLDKIENRNFDMLWPTHGPPVRGRAFVRTFVRAYRRHRLDRENQVISQLEAGLTKIPDIVRVLYSGLDERLFPAACLSVLGHMIKLVAEERVMCAAVSPGVHDVFCLNKPG